MFELVLRLTIMKAHWCYGIVTAL